MTNHFDRPIAVRHLLDTSHEESQSTRERREAQFFGFLHLPNGTNKTTAPGRLRAVDEVTCTLLKAAEVPRDLRVLDVAVSSGVTTAELATALRNAGFTPQVTGTDLYIEALFVRTTIGLEYLFDSRGDLLQVAVGGWMQNRPVSRMATSIRGRISALRFRGLQALSKLLPVERRVPMRLLASQATDQKDIQFRELDLFSCMEEWAHSFGLVRAANILNLSYFDPPQLIALVGLLAGYLHEGGFFVVARTSADGTSNATIFRREGSGLVVASRMGSGSEIESLALGVRL